MIRILVTSFEPFDGRSLNSSLEVGRALAGQPLPGVVLDWLVLPVVAGKCLEQASERIESREPALVLALGEAAGAAWLVGLLREVGRQTLRPKRPRSYPRVKKASRSRWPNKKPSSRRSPQPTKRLSEIIRILQSDEH